MEGEGPFLALHCRGSSEVEMKGGGSSPNTSGGWVSKKGNPKGCGGANTFSNWETKQSASPEGVVILSTDADHVMQGP